MRTALLTLSVVVLLAAATILLATPAQAGHLGGFGSDLGSDPSAEMSVSSCDAGDYPAGAQDAGAWVDHDGDEAVCLELDSSESGDDTYLLDRAACGFIRQDPADQEIRRIRWYIDDPQGDDPAFSSRPVTERTFTDAELSSSGTYHNITLEVEGYCGHTSNETRTVTLHTNQPPVIQDLTKSCDGATCDLEVIPAEPSLEDPQPQYDCSWTLGDGARNGTCDAFTHTYDNDDIYNVTVNVTDRGNATVNQTVTVNATTLVPSANIALSGCSPDGAGTFNCTLTAEDSTDADGGSIATYTWRFGDGETRTTPTATVSHEYPEGTFSANVTVDDGDARDNTNTSGDVSFSLEGTPVPRFDERNGCEERVCTFNASDSYDPDNEQGLDPEEGIDEYVWSFGDGNNVTTQEPTVTHAYSVRGQYEVALEVIDDEGARNETVQSVKVPRTSIEIDAETTCHGRTCILDARGTIATADDENVTDITWNVPTASGDVQKDGPVAVHSLPSLATHDVEVEVSSDIGETLNRTLTLDLSRFHNATSFDSGAGPDWTLHGFWSDSRTCSEIPGSGYLSYTQKQGEEILFGRRDPTGTQRECSYETGSSHGGAATLSLPAHDATGSEVTFEHQGQLTDRNTTERGDFARVEVLNGTGEWIRCGAEWNNTNPLPDGPERDTCRVSGLGLDEADELKVRFRFEADGFEDDHLGWIIRSVAVNRTYAGPIAWHGGNDIVHDMDRDGQAQVTLNASASTNPSGPITNVTWRDSTGATVSGENVTTLTAGTGSHAYSLAVAGPGADGITVDRETKKVLVNRPPVANASVPEDVHDTDGDGSALVTLNGTPSSDADGSVEQYVWMRSDGTIVDRGSTVTVEAPLGTSTYHLEVTDDAGATNATEFEVVVSENEAPTANATATCGGLECSFDGTNSTDDGDDLTYEWAFDDGDAASGAQVDHLYDAPGTYEVELTVIDAAGSGDTDTLNVTVEVPLNATFDGSSSIPSNWSTGKTGSDGENLWRVGSTCTDSSQGGNHLAFNEEVGGDCTYDSGRVRGWVQSPTLDLSHLDEAQVTFEQNRTFGDVVHEDFDVAYLEAYEKSSGQWTEVQRWGNNTGWTTTILTIDGSLVSDETKIRFRFDSGDGTSNDEPGWFVDHVQVRG